MRVLWVLNTMPPMVAEQLHREGSNKEGWVSGLALSVLKDCKNSGVKLGMCFPDSQNAPKVRETLTIEIEGNISKLQVYGFSEDTARAQCYDSSLEESISEILKDFKPDIIHCFGTEYPHTLATLKVTEDTNRVLVGLQGLCFAIADAYMADLPLKVQNGKTFRDILKKDSIKEQQQKFAKRGEIEKQVLSLCRHVTGRTDWDKRQSKAINPDLQYHVMNETLRNEFYTGVWKESECEPYSIFISQGDYPLKGLHYVLEAMPDILKEFPKAHVYVAGQSIIKHKTLKEKIKLSSYGKYLLSLIKQNDLEEKVTFLGKLTASQMKEQYLKSSLFVCASSLENSPNSLGEAMLLGVPCIATKVGGIPTIFHEEDGIFYPPGDKRKLTEAVRTMWNEKTLVDNYTLHAREHALCNHDAKSNYHRLMEIYQEMYIKSDEKI